MKKWKCPQCKRERQTDDDIVSVLCKCGEYRDEVKESGDGHN